MRRGFGPGAALLGGQVRQDEPIKQSRSNKTVFSPEFISIVARSAILANPVRVA
jgi:hypothetical protein